MLLLDVGEERGVAEVVLAAGADEGPLLAVLRATVVHPPNLFHTIYYTIIQPSLSYLLTTPPASFNIGWIPPKTKPV